MRISDWSSDVCSSDLPFVSLSNSATSEGGNAQSEGLATIDLRSLGDSRTLVLIDGRRAVSNSAQANRVSLSSIPDDFIDRVEIIPGGASSIYGPDEIAGRSEERRVGDGYVSTCRSRGVPVH